MSDVITRTPALPPLPRDLPPDMARLLTVMRENMAVLLGQSGDPLDAAARFRDMSAMGLVTLGAAGSLGGGKPSDLTPVVQPPLPEQLARPPVPTGLTAMSGFDVVILGWDSPNFAWLAYTEVWRSPTPNLAQASLRLTAPGTLAVDKLGGDKSVKYYWIRHISRFRNDGAPDGPYSPEPVSGEGSDDPGFMLDLLTGQIRESQLYQSLNARIDLIDADGTGLVDRVTALQDTYGDTASAAESAAEAAVSAAEAIAAKAQSLGASADAIAAKAAAVAAQDGAQAAAVVSESHKLAAQGASADAMASANAAAESKTTAAGYATSAESAASVAQTHRLAAEAAKLNAGTSASAAADSATNAATSASASAASALVSETHKLEAVAAKNDAAASATAAATSVTTAAGYVTNAEAAASVSESHKLQAQAAMGAAANSATAAATNATTAVAKATEAGQSANVATTAKLNAETAAGNASRSESNAATSESNAAGSASSAASSVTLAATLKQGAVDSAAAAAGSASLAATKADDAGISATAANTARLAAEAARDTASGKAAAAFTSAQEAVAEAGKSGESARAASESAGTASTKAGDALVYRNQAAQSVLDAEGYARASALDYTAINARLNNFQGDGVTVEQKMEAQATKVDGLRGQYTLKVQVDQGGRTYVAGIGLAVDAPAVGPASSLILLQADKVAIGAPGMTGRLPFIVKDGNVYINAAFIENATITNAMIQTVTADKLTSGTLAVGQSITVGGSIKGGKGAYSDPVPGFWWGYDQSAYKFVIGDGLNYVRWNGSKLELKGDVISSEDATFDNMFAASLDADRMTSKSLGCKAYYVPSAAAPANAADPNFVNYLCYLGDVRRSVVRSFLGGNNLDVVTDVNYGIVPYNVSDPNQHCRFVGVSIGSDARLLLSGANSGSIGTDPPSYENLVFEIQDQNGVALLRLSISAGSSLIGSGQYAAAILTGTGGSVSCYVKAVGGIASSAMFDEFWLASRGFHISITTDNGLLQYAGARRLKARIAYSLGSRYGRLSYGAGEFTFQLAAHNWADSAAENQVTV